MQAARCRLQSLQPRRDIRPPRHEIDCHIAGKGLLGQRDKHRALDGLLIGVARMGATLRLARAGVVVTLEPVIRLLSSDPMVIVEGALHGLGIAQVPATLVPDLLEQGRFMPVLGDWSMPVADISLAYPVGRGFPLRVKALIDFLVTEFSRASEAEQAL